MLTDFAIYHVGNWRKGEFPKDQGATHVVEYDQRNHAYAIPPEEADQFEEWVAIQWEQPDLREEDESAAEYLERVGVNIREL